jgi:ribosomal protein L40E
MPALPGSVKVAPVFSGPFRKPSHRLALCAQKPKDDVMSDRYTQFANSALGRLLTKNLGLPAPLESGPLSAGHARHLRRRSAGCRAWWSADRCRRCHTEQYPGRSAYLRPRPGERKAASAAGLNTKVVESRKWIPSRSSRHWYSMPAASPAVTISCRFIISSTRSCANWRSAAVSLSSVARQSPVIASRYATAQRALEGFVRALSAKK